MFYTYILYSKAGNRFYIGYTGTSIAERLKRHLTNHSGFTARFKDWIVVFEKGFNTKESSYSPGKATQKKIKESQCSN